MYAVNIIYSTLLYDCDFLWHPQLSLHRITNFTVTFAEKLDSGDDIKTSVSYHCCELQRVQAETRAKEQEDYVLPRVHLFQNVLNQNYTESKCHIIPRLFN